MKIQQEKERLEKRLQGDWNLLTLLCNETLVLMVHFLLCYDTSWILFFSFQSFVLVADGLLRVLHMKNYFSFEKLLLLKYM